MEIFELSSSLGGRKSGDAEAWAKSPMPHLDSGCAKPEEMRQRTSLARIRPGLDTGGVAFTCPDRDPTRSAIGPGTTGSERRSRVRSPILRIKRVEKRQCVKVDLEDQPRP